MWLLPSAFWQRLDIMKRVCEREGTSTCLKQALRPLSAVKVGASVRIKRLPDSPETAHRLREIGFCEEQTIKLLASHSNLICQICNCRLAISSRLADTIIVEALVQA